VTADWASSALASPPSWTLLLRSAFIPASFMMVMTRSIPSNTYLRAPASAADGKETKERSMSRSMFGK